MSRSAWIIGLPLACANAWLIWRRLSQSAGPATAGIGTALILLSPHFVGLHSVAMSEPVYLAGTFLSVLIFLKYAATGTREWLVACGTVLGSSEEHTSELQSLMRISFAVFCLNK